MAPHRVRFLRRFCLKTGIHFGYFGLEAGMVFEGTTGLYERLYRFNFKWLRKKERKNKRKKNMPISLVYRCGKIHFLFWNRVRIRRTGRHTPTKNSLELLSGIKRNLLVVVMGSWWRSVERSNKKWSLCDWLWDSIDENLTHFRWKVSNNSPQWSYSKWTNDALYNVASRWWFWCNPVWFKATEDGATNTKR